MRRPAGAGESGGTAVLIQEHTGLLPENISLPYIRCRASHQGCMFRLSSKQRTLTVMGRGKVLSSIVKFMSLHGLVFILTVVKILSS